MPAKHLVQRMDELDPDDIEWIDGYPLAPAPPLRPLHAIRSVFRLLANKEDTSQVFEITSSLSGRSGKKLFKRFVRSAYGKRVIDEPIKLEDVLADRNPLHALPEGAYGRVYAEFMDREGLTPDGLIEAAAEAGIDYSTDTDFAASRRLFLQLEMTHDLWHVITGYGRDALGELCNLIFTRRQTGNHGFLVIVFIGMLAMKLESPRVKVISALLEAHKNAKKAGWMPGYDVEALLKLPLAEARATVGLGPTPVYDSIPDDVKFSLLKPKAASADVPPHATPAE